jgi:cell division protein FtsB
VRRKTDARARPLRRLLLGAVVVVVALLAAASFKSYRDLAKARAREALVATRLSSTEERIAGLRRRVAALTSDPATLERLAREELGMVRPDDVVIILPPGAPPGPPAAPPSGLPSGPPPTPPPAPAPTSR